MHRASTLAFIGTCFLAATWTACGSDNATDQSSATNNSSAGSGGSSANSGSGGDGSGADNGTGGGFAASASSGMDGCNPESFVLEQAPAPEVYLVIDRSGSMNDPGATRNKSKWDEMTGAVDTDNLGSYDTLPYAVVVSNTDATDTATVKVQTRNNNGWNDIQTAMESPNNLHQFQLPDRHKDHSALHVRGAYRIVSDVPIIAYQFQPITGQTSFSSDASLLLPTSALDRYYYMLSWDPKYGKPQMVIIASEDNTVVTVKPTANVSAGSGVPAISANSQHVFPAINAGDYLQLEGQTNLNGSYITADKPIAVFSAHECANIPTNKIACDHLEEQLFGVQTWGKTYVASRMPVRGVSVIEATLWQIGASEDNTTVSFIANPAVTGLPNSPQSLNKGDVLQLYVSGNNSQHPGDFIINATKPVLVGEYLTCSSNAVGASAQDAGDPAMAQSVPSEQYLDNYVLLVPDAWNKDFAILTKEVGTTISIDNNVVAQNNFLPIDDGNNPPTHEVARVIVSDGVHKLTGSKPFGVIITGYDSYDSYAYPGGLNQQLINPKNGSARPWRRPAHHRA
ncbi:MAG: IgGFc-binding protein [Polyangiaceae bacterium]